ncbi:Uncharacterised protein [Vibrio cholerae]|nr:Uncharacterised protein [Vibrio cholerae]
MYFLANLDRKQAAVMAPPGRPPMFAISANGLLSCSWYSSASGRRHARSLDCSEAFTNSCASGLWFDITALM